MAVLAICRTRLRQAALLTAKVQHSSAKEIILSQDDQEKGTEASEQQSLLEFQSIDLPPLSTRLQWISSISDSFLNREGLPADCGVRDWDFILSLDGSVENRTENAATSLLPTRQYPARYRIPSVISDQLDSMQRKVRRAERFALGCLLYEVMSGKLLIGGGTSEDDIQSRFVNGNFPDDVWDLPYANRILACWCPAFAKDLLAAHSENKTVLSKMASYVKKHPILFGLQVTGGILSLASVVALPILGAVGFGAAGPIAGSVAAGWQSGIGLVEAGSLFAWCQSAAMGGAAVTGIVATGLAGASVAVGSVIMGALDDIKTPAPELKEKFLTSWRWEMGETKDQGKMN